MLDNNIRKQILSLINREVVPAVGCTEPMAVSLCTARAKEILKEIPEKITVLLSANILKNAMGVGIPGTGMIGLPISIALGAIIGKSKYQLEVIKDISPESLEMGKKYVCEKHIEISLKPYSSAILRSSGRRAIVPSSFITSIKAPAGYNPASFAISTGNQSKLRGCDVLLQAIE